MPTPAQNSPAFVTFLTAGYPSIACTVPLMLAMEAGGADVIELGVPFTDPLADGKAIQEANNIAIEQDVDYEMCLKFVREAREQGLKTPVILMGSWPFPPPSSPFPDRDCSAIGRADTRAFCWQATSTR